MTRHRDAAGAIAAIESGQRVFVHGAAATPLGLVDALVDRAGELRVVELLHMHTSGTAAYTDPSNTYDPGGRVGMFTIRFNW